MFNISGKIWIIVLIKIIKKKKKYIKVGTKIMRKNVYTTIIYICTKYVIFEQLKF